MFDDSFHVTIHAGNKHTQSTSVLSRLHRVSVSVVTIDSSSVVFQGQLFPWMFSSRFTLKVSPALLSFRALAGSLGMALCSTEHGHAVQVEKEFHSFIRTETEDIFAQVVPRQRSLGGRFGHMENFLLTFFELGAVGMDWRNSPRGEQG